MKIENIPVFSIKRFAVHDGPGIRTTVFFKGCSLFCPWCQNPEGISKTKNLLYYKNRCIECYSCVEVCPEQAIKILPETAKIEINREKCNLCGECVKHCPSKALEFDSKEYTFSELVKELERDMVFFNESNGGVTFSGGEPLLRIAMLTKIAHLLRNSKIHIAVQTSLMVPHSSLQKALNFVDLFIVDFKLLDKDYAKQVTGLDLELYRKNLEFLFEKKVELICRAPIIPGYTDTEKNLDSIKNLVADLNNRFNQNIKVEPVNFNPLSKEKYIQLGKTIPEINSWKKYSDNEIKSFYTKLNG